MTYPNLKQQANQFPRHIQKNPLTHQTLIPILPHPTPQLILTLIPVLKPPPIYLPIHPHYPQTRIQYILKHTR
ncbi:hypothetical protein, partial [Bacillus pumilus]|uniref:hypothetical protein n=1 Tax=Bacillus pumilus TaxID=1408 RepID=UPI003704C326